MARSLKIVSAALGLAIAATLAAPAAAHHGWGSYDAGRTVVIEAPVGDAAFENPHGGLTLTDAQGKEWHVVLAPPARMLRRGLERDMLTEGTPVRVEGYASKVVPGEMRAERITVGGRTVELR